MSLLMLLLLGEVQRGRGVRGGEEASSKARSAIENACERMRVCVMESDDVCVD